MMIERLGTALRVLALSALSATALAAQQPATLQRVTLDDAIRLAQQNVPGVVQAQGNVRTADAQVRSAKAAYLPSLTASSNGSRTYNETQTVGPTGTLQTGGSSTNSYNFGVSSSIDLFTGFRRGADSRSARANQDAAEANLTNAEAQAALTVTQQFFNALAAQELVRVREAGVKRAEEQLNLSVAKLRVGSATRSDSLRSVVNLGTARLALVSAQSDVAGSQASLARTIGVDGRVEAADDSAFYESTLTLDTASINREALERAPQVSAAEASASAAEASVGAAKAAYWPTLALSGSAGWSGTSRTDYQLFANRQLQLGLSWPIFNRFKREQTIATRLASADAAAATAKDTRRQVLSSLTTQYAALEAARVRIDITRVSVTAAEEDLRVVNERYRVGAATILDVLNSQEALAQAEVDAISARYDYLKAKAQIEALIGRHL